LILRIERQPDTSQNDHADWGFRFSNLLGIDYRWTTAEGYFSQQLLTHNQLYGDDPVEAYGMLYVPRLGQGTLLQIGRYISPPDIEAQLAPNNYLYSHSIFFDFDAYTQSGILASTKLSNYWTLQYGVHAGNDTAPWDLSANIPTGELFGRWISKANKDSVLFGIDALNASGKMKTFTSGGLLYGHDNLQQSNVTWTHVFNPGFHNLFETYYLYSFDAYEGGTINNGPPRFGGGGGAGAFLPGRSVGTGFVDYLEYKFAPKAFWSFRTDYMNDPRGWRSGFATAYGSLTGGVTYKMSDSTMLRPEIRFERAFRPGATPYDNGTRATQASFGVDFIQDF
jgi:putative OmpL-like beta-barrel porin-2